MPLVCSSSPFLVTSIPGEQTEEKLLSEFSWTRVAEHEEDRTVHIQESGYKGIPRDDPFCMSFFVDEEASGMRRHEEKGNVICRSSAGVDKLSGNFIDTRIEASIRRMTQTWRS